MTGRTLAHYQVLEKLGAGGMGEVYRAADTKLGRQVALKILPPEFARDPERLARFEREARVLASLNHPNIAAIYGFEHVDGVPFLVLEYVPGPTLAELVRSGPIEVENWVQICTQVAKALEDAHDKGIVHRDLKPANVKVTPDDKVKVLDFGLAKAFAEEPAADAAHAATVSALATRAGAILGTPAYMSPEQARGRRLDRRTDIWSFGCVLYELLSGRQAFPSETIPDAIAGVLAREPDWQALPAALPERIRDLLRRCLQKDPQRRLQHIGDARILLEDPEPGFTTKTQRHKEGFLASLRLGGECVLALALVALAWLHFRGTPPEQRVAKLSLLPPANASFGGFAISPDGRRLAFTATDSSGKLQLWVRPLDALSAQTLAGTDGAAYPFWSPDSRFIGFFADSKLKKIDASGGPAQTLCGAPIGRGGAWNREGVILFAGRWTPLYRVSAAGGEAKPVTVLDREVTHRWPHFLPDGRHFLYCVASVATATHGIRLGSLERASPARVGPLLLTRSNAAYASGYMFFVRERTLMAQPFDLSRLEASGGPLPVAEAVGANLGLLLARFSVSETGLLVYGSGGGGDTQLAWFDRQGKKLGTVGQPGAHTTMRLSPDDRRVAVNRTDPAGNTDLWVYELARGTSSRFTFHPATDFGPVWSPDGNRIAFRSTRDGVSNLYWKVSTGAGEDEPLLKSGADKTPSDWSRDGRFLIYSERDAKTGMDLWVLPLEGERKPAPFLRTEFEELGAEFSPDGRWLAYQSNASGEFEVYVRPFPAGSAGSGGQWQISTGGGQLPSWRRNGKELFYLAEDGKLMAVDLKAGATFEAGVPRALFQARAAGLRSYDVASDGQRFLINTPLEESAAAPLTVVINWPAGLKR